MYRSRSRALADGRRDLQVATIFMSPCRVESQSHSHKHGAFPWEYAASYTHTAMLTTLTWSVVLVEEHANNKYVISKHCLMVLTSSKTGTLRFH